MSERPSVTMATRAVTKDNDVSSRLKACRCVVREAARRVASIGFGCEVEGVEELELADRLEAALHDYLSSRAAPHASRPYIGNTRGMDQIVEMMVRSASADAGSTETKAAA